MKKANNSLDNRRRLLRRGFAFVVACAAAPAAGLAIEFLSTNTFRLPEGDTLQKEIWLAAGRVEVAGTAEKDLFLLASKSSPSGEDLNDGEILVSGDCSGSIWAVGAAIDISGTVEGAARLLSRTVEISGTVAGNCMLAGNAVHVARAGRCRGDVMALGENVVLEGRFDGDVEVLAASVTLTGEFGGNVRLVAQEITLMAGASIAGNLVYTAPEELEFGPDITIGGETQRTMAEPVEGKGRLFSREFVVAQVVFYFWALLTGIVLIKIFPRRFASAAAGIAGSMWKSLLVGFAGCALMVIGGVFCVFSIVGIPLGVLALGAAAALLYLGKIPAAVFLSRQLLRTQKPAGSLGGLTAMAAALLLIYIAAALPVAGPVIGLVAAFLGMGGLLLAMFSAETGAAL